MEGRELRRWALPLAQAFPSSPSDRTPRSSTSGAACACSTDGSLLAIYEGLGVVKIDRASRLKWKRAGAFHHDLDVAPDGSIWVLDREGKVLPRINPNEGVLEDFVTKLAPNGKVVDRISILRAFEDSPFASFLDVMPHTGDILHTNTLELLDGSLADKIPAFKAGKPPGLGPPDQHAGGDRPRDPGRWSGRSAASGGSNIKPTVLANDTCCCSTTSASTATTRARSRSTRGAGEIVWQYAGPPRLRSPRARSAACSAWRTATTLITEAERGRAVEVTPDNRIVWEYHSPFRTGEQDALVAALLEVIRLDPATVNH
jgi:hypothetical protein